MIEFGVKRASKGKRSRWSKKFPRKRILHRGDEKYCNWYPNNWDEDNYPYFHGNLTKFLISNIGRPVDKVFSKFLGRCRKSASRYNLKQEFYDMFEEKSEIDWSGGFYITNSIVNYKKRTKKPKHSSYHSLLDMEDFNKKVVPNLSTICRVCEESHTKQPFGEFKLTYKVQKRVYLVEREIWLNDLKLQSYYRLCSIYGVGKGVSKSVWNSQDKMYKATYELWDSWSWSKLPEFVFITKI